MKNNIEWLIGKYKDKIEELERDAKSQMFGLNLISGQIRAYTRVVNDLQTLLNESEE